MMSLALPPGARQGWDVLVSGGRIAGPRRWVRELDAVIASEPIRLSHATDERHAVARIAEGGVDLALVCGDAPDAGGLRTLELIRARFADLPCVLVAGEATTFTLRRALELRAVSVIPQPVDVRLLAAVMVRCLRRRFAN